MEGAQRGTAGRLQRALALAVVVVALVGVLSASRTGLTVALFTCLAHAALAPVVFATHTHRSGGSFLLPLACALASNVVFFSFTFVYVRTPLGRGREIDGAINEGFGLFFAIYPFITAALLILSTSLAAAARWAAATVRRRPK